MLLFGGSDDERVAALYAWKDATPELHAFEPDYHRLQLERWLWDARGRMGARVMDVGVDSPRRWVGPGYFTLCLNGGDVPGDLLHLPLEDASLDGAIVTEVLEHCTDPFAAVAEVRRVLKPGGRLFVTSPMCWPQHATDTYRDFWRFTDQGWALLLKDFINVSIVACQWTGEGAVAYDQMRRWECMGMRTLTTMATGYLCEAVRPEEA